MKGTEIIKGMALTEEAIREKSLMAELGIIKRIQPIHRLEVKGVEDIRATRIRSTTTKGSSKIGNYENLIGGY
jgi:hypothetical protein